MKIFDCQLDHHPLIRLSAETPAAAKTEYFRRYAIIASSAAWSCKETAAGEPAPVEPDNWIARRKQLGTFTVTVTSAPSPVEAPPAA